MKFCYKRIVPGVILIATLGASLGCDPLDSFTIKDRTSDVLLVTYTIIDSDGDSVESIAYRLDPGQVVDTGENKGLEGKGGWTRFRHDDRIRVTAKRDGEQVFDVTYTREQVEDMNFTFVITAQEASPTP